ncbi:ester cyclase [Pendulispora albinea]|uniref:Ester cyclase n=1 Tax=Pendulispora albinea TaxID=2741071 RepID=A0ABZ2MB78_9BACT
MKHDVLAEVMNDYNQLWKTDLSGVSRLESVIHPSFERHGTSGSLRGIPAFRRYLLHFLKAFPDLRFQIHDFISHEDKVILRYRFTGTHRDDFMGVPPTGNAIDVAALTIYRIQDRRLRELWDYTDMLSLAEQLDVLAVSMSLQRDECG